MSSATDGFGPFCGTLGCTDEAVEDHHEQIRFSVEDVNDVAPSGFPTI